MSRKVILIDHPVGKRDNRAFTMIEQRGFSIDWRCPGRGEDLPEPDSEYAAAVVFGGAENLSEIHERCYLHDEEEWIARWVEADKPLLGICLGAQLLATALGAEVRKHPEGWHEIGYYPIEPTSEADGFLNETLYMYQWHQEGFALPEGAVRLARGETFENQAFRYGDKVFGIQFHPEVSPPVFQRWMAEAGHMLEAKGAHPAERQLRDAESHDPPMERWFDGFLDRWIGRAD